MKFLRDFWSGEEYKFRTARVVLLVVISFVMCCLSGVMLLESSFIYFPSKYPQGDWSVSDLAVSETQRIVRVEDVYLTGGDGTRLHGWYCTPSHMLSNTSDAPEMAVLFLHGNGGNITHRYDLIEGLARAHTNVFIIDYRGYGRSEGVPSEQGLYKDARAAWNYLTAGRNINANRIVVFGESLGGAVAIQLASQVQPAGLIVQSSFTSIADMARKIIPFFPGFLLRTKMNSLVRIRNVQCPKLFIHSPDDEIVPFEMGRRLFDAAPEPKRFYEVEGATHNATYTVGGALYFEHLNGFIHACADAS